MNRIEDFYHNHLHLPAYKWSHYFKIYERHIGRFVGLNPRILQIGARGGGAIDIWRHYFSDQCEILLVDENESARKFERKNVKVIIGKEGDVELYKEIFKNRPVDIIFDDGEHCNLHQIQNFENLFPWINAGGVYLVEATHTSYWAHFGGGLKCGKSFIEYSKDLVDSIHANHIRQNISLNSNPVKACYITRWLDSVVFYDSVVVAEKRSSEEERKLVLKGNENRVDLTFEGSNIVQSPSVDKQSPTVNALKAIELEVQSNIQTSVNKILEDKRKRMLDIQNIRDSVAAKQETFTDVFQEYIQGATDNVQRVEDNVQRASENVQIQIQTRLKSEGSLAPQTPQTPQTPSTEIGLGTDGKKKKKNKIKNLLGKLKKKKKVYPEFQAE